jgi:hypothetical protein
MLFLLGGVQQGQKEGVGERRERDNHQSADLISGTFQISYLTRMVINYAQCAASGIAGCRTEAGIDATHLPCSMAEIKHFRGWLGRKAGAEGDDNKVRSASQPARTPQNISLILYRVQ